MNYDAYGRKTTMTDPDMGAWSYTYDAAGNLISQKDARNNQLCFTYDSLNRVLTRTQDSTPADPCPATPPTSGTYHLASYSYDWAPFGKGQPATISWGPTPTQNKDVFYYDNLGRMYQQNRLIDNRSYTMQTTSFDAFHRPLTVQYPNNEIVTLSYDREGENTLRAGSDLLVDNVTYNARGQMARLERPNNLDTVFSYYNATGTSGTGNSNFRLSNITAGSLLNLSYTYDKVGNVKTIGDNLIGNTQSFGYDDLNRLITASAPAAGSAPAYNHTYAYNTIGNMTSYAGTTYSYNDAAHKHAVTAITGGYTFGYDANGNMTKRADTTGTYTQIFDAENRLTDVTKSGEGTTTFVYDANGQRVMTLRPDGAVIYTPFPDYEEEVRAKEVSTVFSHGFETDDSWSNVPSSVWPGTSFLRTTGASAAPHTGSYGYAISNHPWGYLYSDMITVTPNTQYDLYAWVRGRLDLDTMLGSQYTIIAAYYDSNNTMISYDVAASAGNLSETWQYFGGRVTTPANATKLSIRLYNMYGSGWVAYDDVSLVKVGQTTNLAPNPGFESATGWSTSNSSSFPGTSFWRGNWGTGAPHSGTYGYSISNHAYGYLDSDLITVTPNAQYDLYAWVRGELDTVESAGGWIVRAAFYDASGTYLNYVNAASGNGTTINETWQQKGGRITVPSNATQLRIHLYNYMTSGWLAYDDVSLIRVGQSSNLVANAGFETATNWAEGRSSSWPGTSFWRGNAGTGAPHSGTYAYSISNHEYGYLQSNVIAVSPLKQYLLSAWVRGKIDPDDSWGYWILRAAFYNASGTYLGYQDAEMGNGSSISETWQKKGGNVTVPANATQMRLQLYNYMNTGWVAFDDVALTTLVDVPATTIRRVTYSLAGQAIAVRVTGDPVAANNGLFYLHSDHLGSTSAMSSSSGQLAGEVARYYPFGAYRSGGPNAITDRGFTGQKENMELGLYYYNARYYVPYLNHFISADTIVPDPANPQSFNRYSYVLNNPLNLIDPSGHRPSDGCDYEGCTLLNGFYPKSTWRLSDGTQLPWDPELAAIEHVHPMDDLWRAVMNSYYQPDAWIDATGDIIGGGDSVAFSAIAELLYREGADISGAEFFESFGKLFDAIGAGFDGLNYMARSIAIYEAWSDPNFDISGEQLYYLNTRAAAEFEFSLGIMGGSMLLGGWPAVAAGATETGWNIYATAGEDRLGPDEWLGREYANTVYAANFGTISSVDKLARDATFLMIAMSEN